MVRLIPLNFHILSFCTHILTSSFNWRQTLRVNYTTICTSKIFALPAGTLARFDITLYR